MAEQVLDVQFARGCADRPGRKCVTEAMRIALGHPSLECVAAEHHVHMVVLQRPTVDRLEKTAFAPASKAVEIVAQGAYSHIAYRSPALLPALALKNTNAVLVEEDVLQL